MGEKYFSSIQTPYKSASGGPRADVLTRHAGVERQRGRETTSPACQGCMQPRRHFSDLLSSSQPSVGAADGRDGGADLVPGRRRRRCGGGGAGRIEIAFLLTPVATLGIHSLSLLCERVPWVALHLIWHNGARQKRCSKKKFIRMGHY